MALFKTRKSQPSDQNGGLTHSKKAGIEDARRRARQRLIGTCVLVLAAILLFPIIFDTPPRPVDINTPITIPNTEDTPPLALAQSTAQSENAKSDNKTLGLDKSEAISPESDKLSPAKTQSTVSDSPTNLPLPKNAQDQSIAQIAAANSEVKKTETQTTSPDKKEQDPKPNPAAAQTKTETPPAPAKPTGTNKHSDEAARAIALLEGKPVETVVPGRSGEGRFIVQVGAFSDDNKAREVSASLQKIGLNTYTQIITTANGRATRVRVGPFSSKADAEKAAQKIHSIQLNTKIIPL